MEYRHLHNWDVTPKEAIQIQLALRDQLIQHPPEGFTARLAAGADVSMSRHSSKVYAGFVVIDLSTMDTVAEATAVTQVTFPYIPGLLSFRELPALALAWKQLAVKPDVLITDGHGRAHPRRMGIACHAGLIFDIPTIGCAKSILVGRHAPLGEERGAAAPLIDHEEVIGMALRTRSGVTPIYVSTGHMMDLDIAVSLILQLTPDGRFRQPETTRRAHALVNVLRCGGG